MQKKGSQIIVVLYNIRSALNVGSIFRTADGAGIKEIFLTGYTPTPIDRFGRVRNDIAKTALGAEKGIDWQHSESIEDTLNALKERGFTIRALEQHKRAVHYRSLSPLYKQAIVMGNEVEGLPESVIKSCDEVAFIPMHGKKESLNVAVAAGIVLYSLFCEKT